MNTQSLKKQRNSSVELLRIIAMFLIILYHYSFSIRHIEYSPDNLPWQAVFFQMLKVGGNLGNNIFILIFGYYNCRSKVKPRRIVNLIAEMFFYAWAIFFGILLFDGSVGFSKVTAIKKLLPVFFGNSNWFCVAYIVLCLFSPFLNKFIELIDKKTFQKLLAVFAVALSVIPSLNKIPPFGETLWSAGINDMFVFMYFAGAYLRLYGLPKKKTFKVVGMLCLVSFFVSVAVFDLLGVVLHEEEFIANADILSGSMGCIPMTFGAMALLAIFTDKEFYFRPINVVAASTLGVLLIHQHENMGKYVWETWFPNSAFVMSPWLPVHALVKCAAIYAVCFLIDFVRIHTVDKLFNMLLDRFITKRVIE